MAALHVLEGEHHLEQWVPRLRPRRVEYLDESLERHVCVREGAEGDVAGARQQRRERLVGVDPGAEHEGVDEHADQVVERLIAAAGDGGAYRDVVGGVSHASSALRRCAAP